MPGLPLIIDCDPGVDDAIALLLAIAAKEALEVLAITTTAGNLGGDLTARNACRVREIANRPDIPVFAGMDRPLSREPVAADHFHGASGLGDLPGGRKRSPNRRSSPVNSCWSGCGKSGWPEADTATRPLRHDRGMD
jgi:inosine-uridine nucleoside N-ribohydrolase